MDQVRELLDLIKCVKINGALVAASFIVRHVQPYKERAHEGFDFKGDTDGTWERTERLSKETMIRRAAKLFAANAPFSVPGQTRALNWTNPPPQVKISTIVRDAFYLVLVPSSELIHLWKDPFIGMSGVLLGHAEERLAEGSGCPANNVA